MGKICQKWLLSILVFSLALVTRANNGKGQVIVGEGILHGYVTDAVTKKPLSGVTVSAIIPGANNPKEVQTNANGYFRFVEMPASRVTIQFDKKGYQPCKRPNITIREKSAVKLNVEFLPEELGTESDNSEYPLLRMLQAS